MAQPSCRVRTFTIRDGLAANTISGFGQTHDDLMWFATWNGLSCYDGYSFTTFRGDRTAGGEVLSSNRILMVKPNKQNDLWCITYDSHLYLFDTSQCRYRDIGELLKQQCGGEVNVRTIYTLDNGHSWVVSRDEGANFCIDDSLVKEGEGIQVYLPKDKAFKGKTIHKVLLDDSGREWVFTEGGATIVGSRFDSRKPYDYLVQLGDVVLLATPTGEIGWWQQGRQTDTPVVVSDEVTRINGLLKLDDRHAVAATDAGVLEIVCQGSRIASVLHRGASLSVPSSSNVKAVFMDRAQRLWVFTDADGVTLMNTKDWSSVQLTSPSVSQLLATTSEIPVFHQDQHGTIWLIPTGGTYSYYDETSQRLVPYVLHTPGSVSTWEMQTGKSDTDLPTIAKFMSDRQDNLWFTGTRALTLINFRNQRLVQSLIVPNQEARAVCVDSKGRTWIGMYTGEVVVVDGEGQVTGYLSANGRLQTTPVRCSNRIYALFEDSKGRLWIGTKGEGLFVRNADGQMTHYMPTDQPTSLSHDEVYGFDEDRHGRVWVATYGGGPNIAETAADGKVTFLHPRNGMKGYPAHDFMQVRRITHDAHGTMILSANSGLLTMRDDCRKGQKVECYTRTYVKGDESSLLTSDVLQTLRLHDDSLMVVTQGGGVQIMGGPLLQKNLRLKNIQALSSAQNLPQSLIEDKDGRVWVIRESSIDRYDRQTGKVETFGPNELGDRIRFSEAQPSLNRQTGDIVLAVMGGSLVLQPKSMKKSDFCPQIVFTGVTYQGEEAVQPVLNMKTLHVDSDKRNLTIYFSALDYSDNDQVNYAYMIEGEDKEWNYVGNAHSASFNHLPHGHLRLLVKSTNSDGVWVDNVKVLEIESEPTFWETWLAKLLYVLLFAGLVALAVYIYRLHTQRKMEHELSEMKTNFFTEISHKLRTPLTLIGGPVTEVLQKEPLEGRSRQLLEMVERNSQRMLALVNRMLTYSREKEVYISDETALSAPKPDSVLPPDQEEWEGALPVGAGQAPSADSSDLMTLLIVEDNDDLRSFLVSILSEDYQVLQAANGEEGLQRAESEMPDLIITDVMMPVMDGLTMVHQIKQNKDICHIPIIVLSAKASLEDRLQGLREGIDDYITKPFSATYLKQRVVNIIAGRKLLQQTYLEKLELQGVPDAHSATSATSVASDQTAENQENSSTVKSASPYQLDTPQIVDIDKEMMNRLMAYLEEHIGDADMRIEDLADAVNLGRSVFYGKLKGIVGMTPVDFVRHLRIQRAEQLIVKSNYPFSQIAYAVGFSDPKYFSKCFKKETGMTPSEYRQKAE